MKYKAICFDVDGTLYPMEHEGKFNARMAFFHPRAGARYTRTRIEFRRCQDHFEELGLADKSFGYKEAAMYCRLFKNTKSVEDARKYLDNKFYKHLEKFFSTLPYQDTSVNLLKMIKDRGYTIGVMSDWPLYHKLELLGVEKYVDYKCDPDNMGFLKPDTHTFEYLLYNLKLDASEVLYVGDSYRKDIEGATSVGIDAVLVGHEDNGKYPKALKVFSNLKEFSCWMEAN